MFRVFLHGLESSSLGAKAVWFRAHFPDMLIPDFTGSLGARMTRLYGLLAEKEDLVLIGSSFGGLMAAIYTLEYENRVKAVFLLAPALNFPDFSRYRDRHAQVPVRLYIGRRDEVCPPEIVVAQARRVFARLTVHEPDDDHFLRSAFFAIDWQELLRD